MANQSKLQLSLLEREEEDLLLIAAIYKFMQFKKRNKRRKHRWWVHDIIRKRFQQGAYHNLVKELELDGDTFQQYFRLTREQFAEVFCKYTANLFRKHHIPDVIFGFTRPIMY